MTRSFLMRMTLFLVFIGPAPFVQAASPTESPSSSRWTLGSQGEILWDLTGNARLPHKDHMAMSGRSVDMILEWQVNPFFPFLGHVAGNESALNSYRHFARFINPDYKPIPSSIVAEGRDIWNGAGDRGDMAMIAYGASRFALASGNAQWSEELWPLITWCLEYDDRQRTEDGVIASNTDELEGRFPAGKANLCTSSLSLYEQALRAGSSHIIDLSPQKEGS